MTHLATAIIVSLAAIITPAWGAEPPTNNPVAGFYTGDDGYPGWTDRIAWDRVIDMSVYTKGKTAFEKFENARDELSAAGGGVLYYPAGTYDFSSAPLDGPDGRGLMLPSGVVIRGQAPEGRPNAFKDGRLELPTKFVFGFRKAEGGEIPRDWALVGLAPGESSLKDVDDIGICWVELNGAVVYFGPDVNWGATWRKGGSWKTRIVLNEWKNRKTDGTHPFAPFVAGGKQYKGAGDGRLVFGCQLNHAVHSMNYLQTGDWPGRWTSRIGVYGSNVFVANNVISKSDKTFKFRGSYLFDYGNTIGIDVNKNLLGVARDEGRCPGYFEPGVVLLDNWVYNHGNKGYEVAGKWVTIRNCHNERNYLKSGSTEAYGIDGWVVSLTGRGETKRIDDTMSRAFDLGGGPLWIDGCTFHSTGSSPGNDGEGILCQLHGGTHIYSWAATHNVHEKGTGEPGYIGGYDVDCFGWLVGWNTTPGWVGVGIKPPNIVVDAVLVGNNAGRGKEDALIHKKPLDVDREKMNHDAFFKPLPQTLPTAPEAVVAKADKHAIMVTWQDTSDAELGFRVERRIDRGKWAVIAYRPPRTQGHERNPQAWLDVLAPPGRRIEYRVVALDAADSDKAASKPSGPVTLTKP